MKIQHQLIIANRLISEILENSNPLSDDIKLNEIEINIDGINYIADVDYCNENGVSLNLTAHSEIEELEIEDYFNIQFSIAKRIEMFLID